MDKVKNNHALKEYALYKGDDLISMGTIYHIAKELNIKLESVKFYNTPSYKKRKKTRNSRELVEIEVDMC